MLLRQTCTILLLAAVMPLSLLASLANDLQSATSQGQTAFVLVKEPGASQLDQARGITLRAVEQVENSVLIEMDRSDTANAELVAKYRLATAPLPLVLVFSSNGMLAGGLPANKATTEALVKLVPSPKKAEVLQALQTGQSVLVTASRMSMDAKPKVLNSCIAACGLMQGKCVTIEVDMDDSTEASFLNELKVNLQSAEPVTVVINAQGSITGSFDGPADVSKLVQAASKKSSGCGTSCAPGACGPTGKKKGN
jgi:hypothetical protein